MDASLIKRDPEEARRQLRLVFAKAGALQARAAEMLGCDASTFSRWVHALDLHDELQTMRAQAKAEGWSAPERRGSGKRGSDVKKRASRQAADRRRLRATRRR